MTLRKLASFLNFSPASAEKLEAARLLKFARPIPRARTGRLFGAIAAADLAELVRLPPILRFRQVESGAATTEPHGKMKKLFSTACHSGAPAPTSKTVC